MSSKLRHSGFTWLDDVLSEQMATEITKRGTDCGDPEAVHAALVDANFGDLSINRLSGRAAAVAAKRR